MKSRQPRAAPSKSSACAGQGGAGGLEEKGDREITSGASATRPEISPAVRYVDAEPLHYYAGGGGIGKGDVRPARAAPLPAAAMGAAASSAATDRPCHVLDRARVSIGARTGAASSMGRRAAGEEGRSIVAVGGEAGGVQG